GKERGGTSQSREARIQHDRSEEVRRRCQRSASLAQGADVVDRGGAVVKDAEAAADRGPAVAGRIVRETDARADRDGRRIPEVPDVVLDAAEGQAGVARRVKR